MSNIHNFICPKPDCSYHTKTFEYDLQEGYKLRFKDGLKKDELPKNSEHSEHSEQIETDLIINCPNGHEFKIFVIEDVKYRNNHDYHPTAKSV
ncbi:MAG: hypothetical protein DSM106950_04950 [Stigonema ocellatum SAG 48.90 = DSM 106950]|nr:hypothetical protein [Stigonema ocellatum SAG 48.90 = DSM 106950]